MTRRPSRSARWMAYSATMVLPELVGAATSTDCPSARARIASCWNGSRGKAQAAWNSATESVPLTEETIAVFSFTMPYYTAFDAPPRVPVPSATPGKYPSWRWRPSDFFLHCWPGRRAHRRAASSSAANGSGGSCGASGHGSRLASSRTPFAAAMPVTHARSMYSAGVA